VGPKGNAITINTQASGTAQIDPLMAAFNAIALMSTNPWSQQASIFVI
jgi:phage terminase large subunit-like protein